MHTKIIIGSLVVLFNTFVSFGQPAKNTQEQSVLFQTIIEMEEKALADAEKLQDEALVKRAHIKLGVQYWSDGQPQKSIDHLRSAYRLATEQRDSMVMARSLHFQGLNHYYRSDFDSALKFYERAEIIYQQLPSDSAIAIVKNHKGLIYSVIGEYNLAIQNMMESYQLQEKTPGNRSSTIAVQLPTQTDDKLYYEGRLKQDLESLAFIKGTNDKEKLSNMLHNIGKDYHYLKQYDKAVSYLLQAAALRKASGHLPFTGDVALAYAEMGNYDSAAYWYKSRLRDLEAGGTRIQLAAVYGDIGNFYKKQNNWNAALVYLTKAKRLYEQMGYKRAIAHSGKSMAQVYGALKQTDRAINAINESVTLAERINSIKDTHDFLEGKAQLLYAFNRDAEAVRTMQLVKAIADTIVNGERQMQIAALQIQYDTEKSARDLADMQLKNSLHEATIKTYLLIGFIVVGSALAAISFLHYRYRQKVKTAKILAENTRLASEQNELLQLQAKQREALLHEIHHRVKNNLQIISSFINLKITKASPETTDSLQQLNSRIFSMGLLHEKLYKIEDLQSIRLDLYLEELIDYLSSSFQDHENPVAVEIQLTPIKVSADIALTCGLIYNELFTNSMKYAFSAAKRNRRIVSALTHTDNGIAFTVSDNGDTFNQPPEQIKKSFGLRFVDQLVSAKLRGEWAITTEEGFQTEIFFEHANREMNGN